jgi:hypothetical protein
MPSPQGTPRRCTSTAAACASLLVTFLGASSWSFGPPRFRFDGFGGKSWLLLYFFHGAPVLLITLYRFSRGSCVALFIKWDESQFRGGKQRKKLYSRQALLCRPTTPKFMHHDESKTQNRPRYPAAGPTEVSGFSLSSVLPHGASAAEATATNPPYHSPCRRRIRGFPGHLALQRSLFDPSSTSVEFLPNYPANSSNPPRLALFRFR